MQSYAELCRVVQSCSGPKLNFIFFCRSCLYYHHYMHTQMHVMTHDMNLTHDYDYDVSGK
jgi:hypothetical protein